MLTPEQRKRVKARHRERFDNDSEYREMCRRHKRDYRHRHRDRINAEWRHRSATDPAFREAERASCQRTREKIKAGLPLKVRPVFRDIGGESVRVYRCSEVARMIAASDSSIVMWEINSLIPAPMFTNPRLYTEHQAKLIGLIAKSYPFDKVLRAQQSSKVHNQWKNSFE